MPDTEDQHPAHPAAIVTGGAQGIGDAICQTLARLQYTVVSADVRHSNADEVTRVVRGGVDVLELGLDVRSATAVEAAINVVERDVGPIEVLVNNAGIIGVGPILEFDIEPIR